jgi:hypothetical protein
MRASPIWAVTGWALLFGALIGGTIWFTGAAFEAAIQQQVFTEIMATKVTNLQR